MAATIDNLGLGFLRENDNLQKFIYEFYQTGQTISGYGNTQFIRCGFGHFDMILLWNEHDQTKPNVLDFDLQGNTPNVWKMRYTGIKLSSDPKDNLSSSLMVFRREGEKSSIIPIRILMPQVIPGFHDGDLYEIQVCGFPTFIQYFTTEEECDKKLGFEKDGKQICFSLDKVFPTFVFKEQFLTKNKSKRKVSSKKEFSDDELVVFKGTVKKLLHGVIRNPRDNTEENTFIWCVIDTQFGELRLCHSYSQLDEESISNIQKGAIVMGTCFISGDVAIYDYSNGICMDLQHHLMLFRSVFTQGDPQRLETILASDAIYESPTHREDKASKQQKVFCGSKEIIKMIKRLQKIGVKCEAEMAITSDGRECVSLAYGGVVETLLFLDLNEKGIVTHIRLGSADDYEWEKKFGEVIKDDKELYVNGVQARIGEVKHRKYDIKNDEIRESELNTNRFLSVKSVENAWCCYSVEKLAKRLSDDFEWDSAWSKEPIRGKDAFLKVIQGKLTAMEQKLHIAPNLHIVKLRESLHPLQYGYAIYCKNEEARGILVFEFDGELIRRISFTDPDYFSFEITGL